MLQEVKALIELYAMKKLPVEATLFVSTYRSSQEFESGNPFGTAMVGLYCNEPRSVSLFHRLPFDEVWHFYSGDPLRLILLYPDGSSKYVIMGADPLDGQYVQFVVPAGVWQAGCVVDGGGYALYGCTMAPGFTGAMFEAGLRASLIQLYPEREKDIIALSLESGETGMPTGFAT